MANINELEKFPPPPAGRTPWPWNRPVRQLPPTMPNGQPWPKITVVTPVYNQSQFLEETIRSVLLQGYPDLEYIIINDGSTDNTVEFIRRYEPWLAYWETQPNSGQPAAINNGLRRSTGKILGFLNSDDLLLPRALERSALARMRKPKVKVTCGFRRTIDENSRITSHYVHPWPTTFDVMRASFIAQETVFWNREVYEHIGPLRNLRYALDYDYWLRLLAAGYEFVLIPHFLGACRFHNLTKTSNMQDVWEKEAFYMRRHYLGRDLQMNEAWNESTVPQQMRVINVLRRLRLMQVPAVTGPILKLTSRAAHLVRCRREPALASTSPLEWSQHSSVPGDCRVKHSTDALVRDA